jgi:hypothetical protein
MTLGELSEALADIAVGTLDRAAVGDIRTMGEARRYFDRQVRAMLGQSDDGSSSTDSSGGDGSAAASSSSSPGLLTALAPMTTGLVSSLSTQAMSAIQPALMAILNQYGPTFAGILGASMGLFVLLGAYIAKESMLKVHRSASKRNPRRYRRYRRVRYA